jgi:hypothetical protein
MPFPIWRSRRTPFALILGLTVLVASTVLGAPSHAGADTAGSVRVSGTVLKTAGSLLKTAGSAVAAQSSAHVVFAAVSHSSSLQEKIVADVSTKGGTETITEGAAVLDVRATPTGAYIHGSSSGLTSLFGLTAAQAKTLGTKWEFWKPGTKQFTNLKSDVTAKSLQSLFPKAKGTKVSTETSSGTSRYVLKWTSAATSTTPKLTNTLTISTDANLPMTETSTDAAGVKVTTTLSKWGEPVVVHVPSPASTLASSKVTG